MPTSTAAIRLANQLFVDYVLHSYQYYQKANPTISDAKYDRLCLDLLHHWQNVTHQDRHITSPEALAAGTGAQLMTQWPQWAIDEVEGRSDI